jgi:predicted Zn-dependent peptidase
MAVEVSVLKNGIRVVTDPMAHVESATLGMWVGVGARHESAELNGVSHLLEHMAFKGTTTRSARAIAEEIENVGGSLNAYTGRESTAYHASVLTDDVPLAVEMIADILRNSTFASDELERERGVILQEIGQALDTPDDVVFDKFQEAGFPDQPLGRPVLGSAEVVGRISRDELFGYMRDRYAPAVMVFAASGKVEHARILDLVQGAFGDLAAPSASEQPAVAARYAGGDRREERDLEQAHLVLGCEGIGYRDPDYYALAVFSTLFGGGMSSRLFQRIREDQGLVYSIYSFNAAYADGGLFGVYAGTSKEDLAKVAPQVCEELLRVGDDVTDAELGRARAQIKAGILMGLESSQTRCEAAARQLMTHGRIVTTEELVAKVEAVDRTAAKRVVGRLLASPPALAAIGPLKKLEPIERIARRLAA